MGFPTKCPHRCVQWRKALPYGTRYTAQQAQEQQHGTLILQVQLHDNDIKIMRIRQHPPIPANPGSTNSLATDATINSLLSRGACKPSIIVIIIIYIIIMMRC